MTLTVMGCAFAVPPVNLHMDYLAADLSNPNRKATIEKFIWNADCAEEDVSVQ